MLLPCVASLGRSRIVHEETFQPATKGKEGHCQTALQASVENETSGLVDWRYFDRDSVEGGADDVHSDICVAVVHPEKGTMLTQPSAGDYEQSQSIQLFRLSDLNQKPDQHKRRELVPLARLFFSGPPITDVRLGTANKVREGWVEVESGTHRYYAPLLLSALSNEGCRIWAQALKVEKDKLRQKQPNQSWWDRQRRWLFASPQIQGDQNKENLWSMEYRLLRETSDLEQYHWQINGTTPDFKEANRSVCPIWPMDRWKVEEPRWKG